MNASVKVAYINAKEKGPSNIKGEDGKYYKVWTTGKAPIGLAQFSVGQTYDLEIEEGEYNGKPTYTVRKVLSASSTQGSNGNGSSYTEISNERTDNIKWLACLKAAGLLYAGTKEVDCAIMAARFMFNEPINVIEDAKKLFNATEAPEKPF